MPDNFANLQAAFSGMSGGDTLIIRNGTYTGDANRITTSQRPPQGNAGAWTIIKAENDGQVIFDGQNVRNIFDHQPSSSNKYWQFEGLIWCRTPDSNVTLTYSRYVKFLRCGAFGCGAGNRINFNIGRQNEYILLENCYAWGSGRYKFSAYQSRRIVFRQCVGRMDDVNALGEPIAIFAIYSVDDVEVQNCIAIDSNQTSSWSNVGQCSGSFFVPSTDMDANRVNFTQCIALNNQIAGLCTTGNSSYAANDVTFRDCVVWNVGSFDNNAINLLRGYNSQLLNCTFGLANDPIDTHYSYDAIDFDNNGVCKNSIIYNHRGAGVFNDFEIEDYNCLYANDNNNNSGLHDITNVNPIYHASNNISGALRYIVRIENNSNLSTRGENNAIIGANCLKTIGAPGSLWGEYGYNTVQSTNLWPFPYESVIRTAMRAYNSGGVSGNRGFCVDGQTLTKYIWEYLGNPMPTELYQASPLTINTTALSGGVVNTNYQQTLSATGGTAPYTWSIVSGSMPNGLVLNASTGQITGIPTQENTFNFTIQVRDSVMATDTQSLSIAVIRQDTTAPLISSVNISNITQSSAIISWDTDEPANSQIQYGVTTSYGSQTALNTSMVTAHSVLIANLTSNTGYHFRILSADNSNNLRISGDYTFTTNSVVVTDNVAPLISSVNISNITQSSATVSWNTDEPANSQIQYGVTTSYGYQTAMNTSMVTSHSVSIANLNSDTGYHFRILSADNSNNLRISGDYTFTTNQEVINDNIAPANIQDLTVVLTTSNSVTLSWTAPGDDANSGTAASYDIRYSTIGSSWYIWYFSSFVNGEPIPAVAGTRQTMTIAGLSSGRTYYFVMKTQDEASNVSGYSNVVSGQTQNINVADSQAPYVEACLPILNGSNIPRDTNIHFCIKDNISGVDRSTIDLSVQGIDIITNGGIRTYIDANGQTQDYNVEIFEKNSHEFVITYDPAEYFNYEDTINVVVNASDLNQNEIGGYSYSFKVQGFVYGAFNSFGGMALTQTLDDEVIPDSVINPAQDNSCIVASTNGKNVYVAWEQRSSTGEWNIYLAWSLNFGENFTGLVQVNPSISGIECRYPALDIDTAGNVYVVWQQQSAGAGWDIYIAKLDSGQAKFSESYVIYNDIDDTNQTKPSIAVGSALISDGNPNTAEPATIYVSWLDDRTSTAQVYYTRTTAVYSDAWYRFVAAPIRVDDDRWPQYCADANIIIDNNSNIFIAWSGINDDGSCSVYFDRAIRTIYDRAENFGTDVRVNSSSSGKAPLLAVSNDGSKVYVLWKELSFGQAKLQFSYYGYSQLQRRYLLNMSTQVNTSILTENELNEYSLKINRDDDAFVVWSEQQGATSMINMAGATSGSYQFLNYANFTTAGNQNRPFLETDVAGYHFFVSWTDNTSGFESIMFCRNTFIVTDQIKSQKIDNELGGIVRVSEGNITGASVAIEANSIDAPVEITLAEVIASPANSSNMQKIGNGVDFGPGGTIFSIDARITIPYTDAALSLAGIADESVLKVFNYNLEKSVWELVNGAIVNTDDNTVSAGISHFSIYTIGRSTVVADAGGGGGGGFCFIATAAFNTPMAKEVCVLCQFRDKYLLTNNCGIWFVKFYYHYSPPLADFIRNKEGLKSIIRACLKPLITLSEMICE
ncbi:MAG: CFI-box-CTERM domain-containing protein [Candidatus Omnitrophota bacterium]